ncbi:phosphatase PAP2 family protein [Salinimicrobium marinum]|uniref:Phosphatase PAP2 family protein n=1 Tax=Salinimicrobium marinum TaxID=680283 RepID=A0A918VV27_9FLAO|nr:phosphatase PAP2 family protein [Salinimicrobium marinum]GHA28400.1 phosphatase PAP2 family protein [Salinimicrobium marinum]
MEQLLELDHQLFLYLNNLGSAAWDNFWNFITNKWSSIPLYVVLLFMIYQTYGLKGMGITLLFVAGLITITDQLANVFKHGFERARPCGQEGVMEYARFVAVRCGRYGYFSAHAASSAAVTAFVGLALRRKYPNIIYVLIFWAIMVSYSRIYVGVHYPLDVATGIFIGSGFGFLFYRLHQYLLRKYLNREKMSTK